MKVKISDVNNMIKEEFQKMLLKKKLSTRLAQIDEAISKMNEEDSILNEVEAGAQTTVASHGWTGEAGGDKKWKPEFEKKGSALKEDDMPGEEPHMEPHEDAADMGEFEHKFAEIGRAIDAKLAAEMGAGAGAGAGMSDEPKDDDFEEVEVGGNGEEGAEDSEKPEMDETTTVVPHSVGDEQHLSPEKAEKIDEPTNNLKGEVQESVEEPLEGESVAQMTDADKVNDNMEKDKHVHENKRSKSSVITEAKTAKGNIFTEGLDDKKKASLLSEMKRMSKFAGLTKDDDEK